MAKKPVKPLKTEGTRKTDAPLSRTPAKKTTGTRKTNTPRKTEGNLISRKK